MSRQYGGWRGDAVAGATFIALSLAFTWPLLPNLSRAVADPGDPLLNIWILDWDWWATWHDPLSLFHANAFHPARYALAFSENLYGVALLLFPLRFAGVGPIAAYNLAILGGFALSGFGAYVLGRRLTGSFAAGLAAGVFYAFVPFRFVHLSQVQHVWGGWLPLLLAALLAYGERPTWKRGVLVAAVFLMNGLTNIHYLLFGALAIAFTALLLIPRSAWRELIVPMLVALILLLPFLVPYIVAAEMYGMQRGWEEVWTYSAMPSDWLPGPTEPEKKLFPGALALIVAVLALIAARREKAKLGLGVLWIVIGFLGSLGLHFVFHEFLYGAVPGFRAIRAPARWAVIAYIGLAILIALFTAAVARRNRWIALLVPAAFAVTLWRAPLRWFLVDPQTPPVYTWLAKQKVTAIVELPMDTLASDYEYMLHATVHRQRFVNGVSGFAPQPRVELSRLSRELSDSFVERLRDAGVDLVVVHSDRLGGDASVRMRDWIRRELERGRLRYVAHFDAKTGADWVFSLGGGAGPRPHELNVFLAGGATCTSAISGALDFPPGGHPYRGPAGFRGWAWSPHGIAAVDVLFENRRVRHRARLTDLGSGRCPGPPAVRYELSFPSRPAGIRTDTDVMVEVTDRSGGRAVFEDRWISWR